MRESFKAGRVRPPAVLTFQSMMNLATKLARWLLNVAPALCLGLAIGLAAGFIAGTQIGYDWAADDGRLGAAGTSQR